MTDDFENDRLVRQYLFGALTDVELEQFETRLITSDALFDRVLLAEEELVDDYVQDRLSISERKAFEESFLATPDGRRQVMLTKALRVHTSRGAAGQIVAHTRTRKTSSRWFSFTPLRAAAVAASVLLVASVGVWQGMFHESDTAKGRSALAEAYRNQRPFEGRITGWPYAPFSSTRGGLQGMNGVALDRAKGMLLEAEAATHNAESRHGLGLAYLASGDFDQAVSLFEEALQNEPNQAQFHSDYAIALMERAKARARDNSPGKALEDLGIALEHLNKAIQLKGNLLEALFNRALVNEALKLYPQAEADWRQYLEKDPTSGWADEARRHLEELEQKKSRTKTTQESLFDEFMAAFAAGDSARASKALNYSRGTTIRGLGSLVALRLIEDYYSGLEQGRADEVSRALAALRYAGSLDSQNTGDRFLMDLAGNYQIATAQDRLRLIEARRSVQQGIERYEHSAWDQAISAFGEAIELSRRAGSTGDALCGEYRIALCHLIQLHSREAFELLQPLAEACKADRYEFLSGLSSYSMANAQLGLGNFSAALGNSSRYLEVSERLSDVTGILNSRQQMAHEFLLLKNYEKALEYHQRNLALRDDPAIADPLIWWREYLFAALPLNELKMCDAATAFQKEAVRLAEEIGRTQIVCRSLIHLGVMSAGRRDFYEAVKSIESALELGGALSSETARDENAGYASLQLGNVYALQRDFARARASYVRSISLYEKLNAPAFRYAAWKGKALASIALGDSTAGEDIETALSLFEGHLKTIVEERNRVHFLDTEENLYDAATRFALTQGGDKQLAFDYTERGRCRFSFDWSEGDGPRLKDGELIVPAASEAHPFSTLINSIPSGMEVVEYTIWEDRVGIWVLSGNGLQYRHYDAPLSELEGAVTAHMDRVSTPRAEVDEVSRTTGRQLYKMLISPIEDLLPPGDSLCIVPNKFLNLLAFGTLISPTSGEYLIQERELVMAPSLNLFISNSELARQRGGDSRESALAVGNPSFDARVFPDLKDLPAAEDEARVVAAYYHPSVPLIGAAATKERLLGEMGSYEVLHIATHAVVDETDPLRSGLVLAADSGGEDSCLHADEICSMPMRRARIVVLSACRSGVERYYGGEGMVGIARAFLAAGVPVVVASMWRVDSGMTAKLMKSFHYYRTAGRGLSASGALREAQLQFLKEAKGLYSQPYYWASFAALGGRAGA